MQRICETLIENNVVIPAYGQSYSWTLKIDVAGTNASSQPYPNEPYFDSQGQIEGYWKTNLGTVATSPALAPSTTRPHPISVTGYLPIYFGTGNPIPGPYNSNNYLAANFALPSATNPIPRGSTSWTNPYQALWGGGTILCYQPFDQVPSQNQLHCFMLPDSLTANKTVTIGVWDLNQQTYVNNNSFWTTGPSITLPWINTNGYTAEVFTPYYSTDVGQGGDPSLTRAKYNIQVT